jgi:iron complex transport system substrate-binding protein
MKFEYILKKLTITCSILIINLALTCCTSQEGTSAGQEIAPTEQEITSTEQENAAATYLIDITFEGGTGKAFIKSPVEVTKEGGKMTARFVWSSKNYDYMIVAGNRYDNENEGGESTFTVPIDSITGTLSVIGDTVAMSTPHEVEYTITWGEKHDAEIDVTVETASSSNQETGGETAASNEQGATQGTMLSNEQGATQETAASSEQGAAQGTNSASEQGARQGTNSASEQGVKQGTTLPSEHGTAQETAQPTASGTDPADKQRSGANSESEAKEHAPLSNEAIESALKSAGLSKTGETTLQYATGFKIEKFGDYTLLSIENSGDYLLVPENGQIPRDLPKETVILQKPLDKTYIVSTAAMDLINTCGALNMISLSGTRQSDWYIDEAKEAMEKGDILYAGKYRAPDYELILSSGCNLAIENTMIYHGPAVKEKLQELGIPVLVETSSYEEHPLGRLEWIKLYGALFDHEDDAEQYFKKQMDIMGPILQAKQSTGKTVAFFHVTAGGLINVRKYGDYITKMIELSGGSYCLESAGDGDNALSTMNMQMEDFYREASEADILIYNSTIGGEITSIDELIDKNVLFSDFKAVEEKEVYCTERDLFQQTTGMAEFMQDLSDVFLGIDRDYTYLKKLD